MTLRRLSTYLIITALVGAVGVEADEVHPSGTAVTAGHTLNTASLRGGDTLIITRTLVNDGNAPLTGVYLTQTLPPEFYIIGSTVKINGSPVTVSFSDKPVEPVMAGYDTYRWILDDPTYQLSIHHWVEPGASVELTIRTVCGTTGQYVLPDRAAVFFAGGNAGFAVMSGSPPVITIEACCVDRGNVDGIYASGGPIDVADLGYLVNYLFRDGAPPPCAEEANADASTGGGVQVNISDLSFIVEYLFRNGPSPQPCFGD